MNCEQFQKQLPEHVEGSLSTAARAAADRHLACCESCREAVRQEQQFVQVLSDSLRQETKTLTLRPDIRQHILAAARRKPAPPSVLESIADLWNRFAWPAAISLSVLFVVTGMLMGHFSRPGNHVTETARSNEPSPHDAVSPSLSVSFQIAYRLPAWKFRREGDRVMDTLSYETVIASGTLSPGGPLFARQKPESNRDTN